MLERVAPGWTAELAYRLVPDLTTWRLTGPAGAARFAKVATGDRRRFPTLRGESERMVWGAPYLPVPEVVAREAGARVAHRQGRGGPGLTGGNGYRLGDTAGRMECASPTT